jgi:hypothetical protein
MIRRKILSIKGLQMQALGGKEEAPRKFAISGINIATKWDRCESTLQWAANSLLPAHQEMATKNEEMMEDMSP